MNTPEKTAVATGANSGIDLPFSQKLLAEGYRVIGTSRRKRPTIWVSLASTLPGVGTAT